jgi:hypothetical protein
MKKKNTLVGFLIMIIEEDGLGTGWLGEDIGLFGGILFAVQRNMIIEKVVDLDSLHARSLLLDKLYIK